MVLTTPKPTLLVRKTSNVLTRTVLESSLGLESFWMAPRVLSVILIQMGQRNWPELRREIVFFRLMAWMSPR